VVKSGRKALNLWELIGTLPAYIGISLGIDRYSARLYRIKSQQKPDSNRIIPKNIEKAFKKIDDFFAIFLHL